MSLKKDIEEAKKGNIRFADQLGMTAGFGLGHLAETAAGKSFDKAVKEEQAGMTSEERRKFMRRKANELRKRDPSLKVAIGKMDRSESLDDDVYDAYAKRQRALENRVKPGKLRDILSDANQKFVLHQFKMNRPNAAQYRPHSHTILVPKRQATEAIFEHEAGHAKKGLGKKVLQSKAVKFGLPTLGLGAGLKSFLSADKAYKAKSNKEKEKQYRKARNELGAAVGLTAGPTLLEEARASANALKQMKGKRLKALKQLVPAYGTYAAKPLAVAAGGMSALDYYRRKAKKAQKK